jgi:Transposase DDE domain
MTLDDYILNVFCLVDDQLTALHLDHVRQRGFAPRLYDSEVVTIELVGEFLGFTRDAQLFWYFRRHHADAFPALRCVHRTTFLRQAANLWAVQQRLQQHLAAVLTAGDPLWHVDSMPVHACQFARAPYCQRFAGAAAFGKDHVIRQTFYGFRLHLRTSRDGIIEAAMLAPANAAETDLVWELAPPGGSTGIGDRNYWSPGLMEELAQGGIRLLAPFKSKKYDPDPARSRVLRGLHWLIETVNGQLADRFGIKRTWAKDLWHLCSRIVRKILSHTVAAWINVSLGHRPLDFASLVSE